MFRSPMKFQASASVFFSDALDKTCSSDTGIAYYAKQACYIFKFHAFRLKIFGY